MKERRRLERFDLELQARITVKGRKGIGGNGAVDLTTQNLSSGGAFFHTDRPLPEGTKVFIEIILPLEGLKKAQGNHALLSVQGKVLRSGPKGMAVGFNKRFNILPLLQGDRNRAATGMTATRDT